MPPKIIIPNEEVDDAKQLTDDEERSEKIKVEKLRLDRKVSHVRYANQIQKMDYTSEQKEKLRMFLNRRVNIENLSKDDLAIEGELGVGNGGVVLKVRHKKTDIEMAKKVNI